MEHTDKELIIKERDLKTFISDIAETHTLLTVKYPWTYDDNNTLVFTENAKKVHNGYADTLERQIQNLIKKEI